MEVRKPPLQNHLWKKVSRKSLWQGQVPDGCQQFMSSLQRGDIPKKGSEQELSDAVGDAAPPVLANTQYRMSHIL